VTDIAGGGNDLLVNIAVNKGHWDEFGTFTMCMKNHFGTFTPEPYPGGLFEQQHANLSYLLAVNASDILIGGLPPQQQLCIVDSIWAGSSSNMGGPGDDTPYNRLVMGTFAPAVDCLTAKHIRQNVMGVSLSANADLILPAFGFTNSDIDSAEWVEVGVADPGAQSDGSGAMSHLIHPEISDLRVVCCRNDGMIR
jgi:hypothetical protein